ncbi:right-handed parallel beta-helix repeat-containing protein [Bradyrhizobium sp. WSM 1704]|uniref:right-handed parallel beta-helix repeat-containing protein n=1 Tax=Bradyrhizobium semiaridum TaxID=2821404 RepID=UPI001CE2AB66|nr:right-handed parallel beta-helix repeat-containing protein [Bradyrhizobium semiaridum]MCA6122647.1 right-handed parallel beta-helix repeat-containing protein [Bradyrhizobium semiaridum]
MHRLLTLIAVLLTTISLNVQWTSEASAAVSTYVSTSGNDANDCFAAASACRTLAGALAKTDDGGNVQCVDLAVFGGLTITKSVTIDCAAGGGAVSTQQIIVNAPGKTVILRNIAVNPLLLPNFIPIDIQAAGSVYIENVLVAGARGSGTPGIKDHRAGPAVLVIRNSSIVSNAGVGILVAPTSGVIGVELDTVHADYNRYGLAVASGGRVMIKNSVFTSNGVAGIHADPGTIIGITSTQSSFNSIGVSSSTGATVSLHNSTIDSNSVAIQGPTQSAGGNRIFANSSNGQPPTQ